MNISLHVIINSLVSYLLKITYQNILLIALGGVLIDFDHILYAIFNERIFSPRKMHQRHKLAYNLHRPSLYLFHTIEFIALFILISYYTNYYLFFISIGFLMHGITDSIAYLFIYKSFSPWARYFSLIAYFSKLQTP